MQHTVKWAAAAAALGLAAALTACGAPTNDPEATGGGALVVGRAADIDGLDPSVSSAFTTLQSLSLVYEGVTGLDENLDVVPRLAESWEFSPDGRELTLHLRQGVTFHDGSALDAADVVATLQRLQDPETGSAAASNLATVTGIEAIDDLTVLLTLDAPKASLPAVLADPSASIFPSEAIEAGTLQTQPVGTGPYAFEDWERGQQLDLVAYDGYWGEAPASSSIEIRVIPDESSVIAGIRSGELDFAVIDDPVVASQLDGSAAEVVRVPSINYHALMLQSQRGPLTDPDVRLAISCAIDRQAVVDAAALGEGEVTGPITIPAYRSDPADAPCAAPDVDAAKELLAGAGYPEGFSLNTIVPNGQFATAQAEAQVLQAQLAEIGVDLQLEVLESDVYSNRWLAGDFDAAVALNSGKADPDVMYGRYFRSDGSLNPVVGYSSPDLDDLLSAGASETDVDARKDIYREFSDALFAATPWVWIYSGYDYRVMAEGTEGFVAIPNGSLYNLAWTSSR